MSTTHVPGPATTESRLLQDALEDLCAQVHLIAVYAFGRRATEIAARVRGEQVASEHPGSDVGVGVLPARRHRLWLDDKLHPATELDLLNAARVDLVRVPEVRPDRALDVVCGERLCVTDADPKANCPLHVMGRAADLAPHERERRRMILAGEAI